MSFYANYFRKGQMKIQEMAFVLIAIMIFFALVALFYFTIRMNELKGTAATLQEDAARAAVQTLASSPEFGWTATECSNCVDMDKLMAIKNLSEYKKFWGLDYLKIERVYPIGNGECTAGNYPTCASITLIPKSNFGTPPSAFVSLCRYDFKEGQSYARCEIGKIYATKLPGGTG